MEDNKNSLDHLKILLGELLDSLNESNRELTEKVEKLGRKVEDLSVRVKELEENAGAYRGPGESGLIREDAGRTAERPAAGSGKDPEENRGAEEAQQIRKGMEGEEPGEDENEAGTDPQEKGIREKLQTVKNFFSGLRIKGDASEKESEGESEEESEEGSEEEPEAEPEEEMPGSGADMGLQTAAESDPEPVPGMDSASGIKPGPEPGSEPVIEPESGQEGEALSFETDWQPAADAGFEIVPGMEIRTEGEPAGEDPQAASGKEAEREDPFTVTDSGDNGEYREAAGKEAVPKTILDAVRPDWYDWEVDYPAPYIDDVFKGIAVNDKLLFVRELFGEDEEMFKNTLEKINTMENFKAVVAYMREYYPQWNEQSDEVYRFYMAVRRRFNR